MEIDLTLKPKEFFLKQMELYKQSLPKIGRQQAGTLIKDNFAKYLASRGNRYHETWGWLKRDEPLNLPLLEDGTIKTMWVTKPFTHRQVDALIGYNESYIFVDSSGKLPIYKFRVADYGTTGAGLSSEKIEKMFE